jgi:hypothetical protein
MTSQQLNDEIEKLMDKVGLEKFTTACAVVCSEKADHVQVNWQDKRLAKMWQRWSRWFYKTPAVGDPYAG